MAKLTLNKLKSTEAIWIPQVPEHWELVKVRHLFKESTKKGYPNEKLLVASQEHGVVSKDAYGKRTVEATKDLQNLKLVEKGDFVISLRSFQGGIEVAHERGIISPAYTVMKETKQIEKRYFKNLFKSPPFISLMTLCVKGIREGQNIDYPTFKNEYLPFPPLEEQQVIAAYLDKKNNEIDKFIRNKERLIELLEEQKGIKVDNHISNTRCLKSPLKFFCKMITDGSHFSPNILSEGMNYVSVSDVGKNDDLDLVDCKKISEYDFRALERNGCRPTKNDILLTKDGTIGRAFLVKDRNDFVALSSLAIIRPNLKKINPYLLRYLLISPNCVSQMYSKIQGSALTRLTIGLIKNLDISIPIDLKEQDMIVKEIDEDFKILNLAISKSQKEIAAIKEYREALITDLVTGKRSVPQLQLS